MTTYGLGPTKLYARSERLLHGKGMESAIGRGEAEDWIGLDSEVKWVTYKALHPSRRSTSWTRVGFLAVPQQEIADWERAPSWQEDGNGAGAPSWSAPPTESEIALCLSHADPRLRAAALALDARGALPDSVLPLVLIRSADTDERVRTLARAVLDRLLADADDTQLRRLAPLAALAGEARRYGDWARRNVLDRIGGLPDEALAHLLTSHRRESRRCALDAAGAYGNLAPARIWALAEQDPDEAVRGLAVATALRLALDSGQQTAVDDARSRFLAHLDDERAYGLRLRTFATAVASDFLRIDDLATLATTHRYRKIRWHACSAVLAHPRGDTVLDRLLTARDTRVRAAAVDRLRLAGRGDELPRYLTDLSGRVRAAACREVRPRAATPTPTTSRCAATRPPSSPRRSSASRNRAARRTPPCCAPSSATRTPASGPAPSPRCGCSTPSPTTPSRPSPTTPTPAYAAPPSAPSAAPPASCANCATAHGRTCGRTWRSSWSTTSRTAGAPAAAARPLRHRGDPG
ncbi:hypothetical protein [Streptomyces sp. NPDC002644]